jgi:hypothetical protein
MERRIRSASSWNRENHPSGLVWIDRFQDVPSEELDSALLAATRPGWITVLPILGFTLSLSTAFLSMELYRLMLPDHPGWPSVLVCAMVASALCGLLNWTEGRWILYRIGRLLR